MTKRKCDVGHEAERTTFYLQDPVVGARYVTLCPDHAKSRRAMGYTLHPVRKSKGTY